MRYDVAFALIFLGAFLLIAAIISYALVGFWLPIFLLALGMVALLTGLAVLIRSPRMRE